MTLYRRNPQVILKIMGFPAHSATIVFDFKNVHQHLSWTLVNVPILVSISALLDQFLNAAIQFHC